MSEKPFPFSVCKDCCAEGGTGGGGDYANAVKETITGVYLQRLVLEDVSPVEHIVKLRVASLSGSYDSAVVYVSDDNGTINAYTPNPDGTVDGVTSFSPKMVIWGDPQREIDEIAVNECEYNRDLNHVLSSMNEATEELQKPHVAELVETFNPDGLSMAYFRSRDVNDNPYNFKAMYVHVAIKPSVNNRIEIAFYDSDDTLTRKRLCQYQFTNTAGNDGYISVHADVIGGMWQAIATAATKQGVPTNVQMWGYNHVTPYGGENIGCVEIRGGNTFIDTNATITIYGVR